MVDKLKERKIENRKKSRKRVWVGLRDKSRGAVRELGENIKEWKESDEEV